MLTGRVERPMNYRCQHLRITPHRLENILFLEIPLSYFNFFGVQPQAESNSTRYLCGLYFYHEQLFCSLTSGGGGKSAPRLFKLKDAFKSFIRDFIT